MHFLRTLFWVIMAVALLIFATQNNKAVEVNLWGGLQADVKLWLLVVGPFLLGFLPTLMFHKVSLWQRRRQASAAARRMETLPSYEMQTATASDVTTTSHPAPSPAVSPMA